MIKKIRDSVWEIGTDEAPGMKVPVWIYANDKIMEQMQKDRTIRQAINSAKLPSMVKRMMIMPDGHEGYGFPVGGVAAFDAENGIVSPGICGFDINCLEPNTKVQCEHGTWTKIKDMTPLRNTFSFDTQKVQQIKTTPVFVLRRLENSNILKIKTTYGKELLVTGDHPILTRDGMKNADKLKPDTEIVARGWEGLEYTKPGDVEILNEQILRHAMDAMNLSELGNSKNQIIAYLKNIGLSELFISSANLPTILKIMGMVWGDGTVQTNGFCGIYGKPEDLDDIKCDVEKLGFKCNIQVRERHSKIITRYGPSEFDNTEYSLHVGSKSFGVFLYALGVPIGNKSIQRTMLPKWMQSLESWQKRQFLAAYFGAEMSKPMSHNGYNFSCPAISVNKLEGLVEDSRCFLSEIKDMLESLSIKCIMPKDVEGYRYKGKNGETLGVRLCILSNTENLMRFFGTVGYAYNREKERLASLAVLYLGLLQHVRGAREGARKTVVQLYAAGVRPSTVVELCEDEYVSEGFIRHAIWSNRKGGRAWDVIKFSDFCDTFEIGGGYAYDTVESIEAVPYNGYVYDLTINDDNHNFVANGVVVSNCGVRLVKTNLDIKEVRPKLSLLMDNLFKNVPSGVGSKVNMGFTQNDLERIAVEGSEYVIGKGFGWKDDQDRTEENGCMEGADMSKVSPMAKKRGVHEVGTLGAGNHFL